MKPMPGFGRRMLIKSGRDSCAIRSKRRHGPRSARRLVVVVIKVKVQLRPFFSRFQLPCGQFQRVDRQSVLRRGFHTALPAV